MKKLKNKLQATCLSKNAKYAMTAIVKQQTLEEERKSNAAFQLLLTEIVRQNLGCEEGRK
jgi:hypothetical protein